MTVLIVEDEWVTGAYLRKIVEVNGHSVFKIVDNGEDVLSIVENNTIDLIFMDININGSMDGLKCASILSMNHSAIPIIFVTAYSDRDTIDESLKTNIYGFVNKPFEALAIEIAIKIACKRMLDNQQVVEYKNSKDVIELSNGFSFVVEENTLKQDGIPINLTKTETKILFFLASNKDKILDISQITNYIWGGDNKSDSSLRNVIYKLRKKVPHLTIESIHAMGYMLRTT